MANYAEYSKAYRERQKAADPEGWKARRRAQDAAYRARHAEAIRQRKACAYKASPSQANANKAWKEANPERYRAILADWYARHRDDQSEKGKARYLAIRHTPEYQLRAIHREGKRRAAKRSGAAEPVDFAAVLRRAEGRCGICREPLGDAVHYDHIMPLAIGGAHREENLQATHPRCNLAKGKKVV